MFTGCKLPCVLLLAFIPDGDRVDTLIKVPVFAYDPLESESENSERLLSTVTYQTSQWILEVKSCAMIDNTPTPALVYFAPVSNSASPPQLESTLRKVLVSQRFAYGVEEPIYFFYNQEPECIQKNVKDGEQPFGLYLVHTDSAEPLRMPSKPSLSIYELNRWISISAV